MGRVGVSDFCGGYFAYSMLMFWRDEMSRCFGVSCFCGGYICLFGVDDLKGRNAVKML